MPPTNDTGSVITVGPDVNGDHFDVQPGDDYELPEPPRTVLEDEMEAGGEETPEESVEEPEKPVEVPKPEKSTSRKQQDKPEAPAPDDKEGNPE